MKKAKEIKNSENFFVIARIESFILGKGIDDALRRAKRYSIAGADAIVIHSKEKKPKQIFEFAKKFLKTKEKNLLLQFPHLIQVLMKKI